MSRERLRCAENDLSQMSRVLTASLRFVRLQDVCNRRRSGEHLFVPSQISPMRFRRALDRGNVTEALSAASELQHVGLSEALELCLLIRDKAPHRYDRAALRWHGRLAGKSK